MEESAVTFPEAVEEILAIAIATYLDGQRRERLREAIELSVRTLDLSALRFGRFATCSGAPFHCRPSAQNKAPRITLAHLE
jgi:hypothetical protein